MTKRPGEFSKVHSRFRENFSKRLYQAQAENGSGDQRANYTAPEKSFLLTSAFHHKEASMSNRMNKVLVMIPSRIRHEEAARQLRTGGISGPEAV